MGDGIQRQCAYLILRRHIGHDRKVFRVVFMNQRKRAVAVRTEYDAEIGVKCRPIRRAANRHDGDLPPRLRIENHHLPVVACRKQSPMGGINGEPHGVGARGKRPSTLHRIRGLADDHQFSRIFDVHKKISHTIV